MTTLLLLMTMAAGFPYPPDWNPNAKPEMDGTCAAKFRGRQFVCTTLTADGTTHVDVVYVDRLPPDERPGEYDMTVPPWGLACVCGRKGKTVLRDSRVDFVCAGGGGAMYGRRNNHSDFNGVGLDGPYAGAWRTKCDDFDY